MIEVPKYEFVKLTAFDAEATPNKTFSFEISEDEVVLSETFNGVVPKMANGHDMDISKAIGDTVRGTIKELETAYLEAAELAKEAEKAAEFDMNAFTISF